MTEPIRELIPATSIAGALDLPRPTPEQVAVIEAPLEPVLVVAGAGAGKTETMAARVVWLVVNRFVGPEEVLGLTFTRKAASELGARIRRRLAALAGAPVLAQWDPDGSLRTRLAAADPEISTYHAYAGRLIADYGLLLPVEPSSTLLSETELWQLAFSVVANYPGDLQTRKVPTGVTETVLKLYSDAAEHLVGLDDIADAAQEFYDLIDTLPKGKGQNEQPSAKMRGYQAVIDERRALLPLVAELAARMREQSALDFGSQMSLAARLVVGHPEVVAAERATVRAVLLDEYQDTGHSQRVLLRALFGGGAPVAVTAVGDPIQSIYGWRGASAANLPRFATDFPRPDASPARRLELLTSWRNAAHALRLANAASDELRRRGVPVSVLRPRPDAPLGTVTMAMTETVLDERKWIAQQIAAHYSAAADEGQAPPTTAILVRRNEDSAPLAVELEALGIPAEVVGIGGLLHVPEVADVIATLRLMADPMAGTAAMRLLTGPRWQLGAADLAALWRRARELAASNRAAQLPLDTPEQLAAALAATVPDELVDDAGIADALVDAGDASRYSEQGYGRIRRLGAQLDALRRRIGQPLPELVADVEETIGVGVEAQIRAHRMRGATTGREHLDAFAAYVSDYADKPGATLPGLLAFLDTAATIEKGLEPGRVEVAEQRVQILTVHAAKGLEWDVVAIPHVCGGIFPSGRSDGTWLGSARELPAQLRGDLADPSATDGAGEGFPRLEVSGATDRKELEVAVEEHKEAIAARRLEEDRRLLYVALTRAKESLLISAHHWSMGSSKPRAVSEFYAELATVVAQAVADPAVDSEGLVVDIDVPVPDDGTPNPLAAHVISAQWPADRLGPRREPADRAAALVAQRLTARAQPSLFDDEGAAQEQPPVDADVQMWRAEVDVLLDEHAQANRAGVDVELPAHLSVSQLVDLRADAGTFAQRLRRPVPFKPNALARRGTAFHAWVERRFGATRLLDIDELPGAADETAVPDEDLALLIARFSASRWANRTPIEVEVPFETVIGPTVIRGRIDAVFTEPDVDGEPRWIVVDWKTGAPPEASQRESVDIQLAAYRIAWAKLVGARPDQVRAAFHYVRPDVTLEPTDLPDAVALAALLTRGPARSGARFPQ
ncbi:MAG TPA: UvrD-helicase domain-containing protein [Gordonia sp. (in: high G+C Gram-positive bacteria)]|uniref:ATP-dependent helicase n=1 Tax=unclassified Gordonia (in: high G+C Gram-positive bacteria) TaxID=2657482 RepID=UPI0025C2D9C7|nr:MULTISPECIES: UvrD-helicase domain-containing protein [unclassified Gordonia (in: high G+C Gram-positive bacteria)]HNP56121.1 UvrD-helicase domain-containing protein [Gordonia sp. (in: high G+C Gram-positive bacteria)]HRC49795.1 UvrD-helicase domain-containing protein [Gordonia sp. (in: high G+C Gram-positive bacteria)]